MKPFHMSPTLMTGHIQIDTEHEHLLVLLNQFDRLLKTNDDEGCAATLTELTEALENHLINEENILKGHRYPGVAKHIEQHEAAKNAFLELVKESRQNGYGLNFSDKLIAILADDLITADLDFKIYLEKMAHKG